MGKQYESKRCFTKRFVAVWTAEGVLWRNASLWPVPKKKNIVEQQQKSHSSVGAGKKWIFEIVSLRKQINFQLKQEFVWISEVW
jgi:hypothetical protein